MTQPTATQPTTPAQPTPRRITDDTCHHLISAGHAHIDKANAAITELKVALAMKDREGGAHAVEKAFLELEKLLGVRVTD